MPRAKSSTVRRAPVRRANGARKTNVQRFTRGRGAYTIPHPRTFVPKGFFTRAGKLLGSAGGAVIGTMVAPGVGTQVGKALGNSLGELGGSILSRIAGFGAYQVKMNTLLYPTRPGAIVPSFGEDSIRVMKREYIGSISGETAFTNTVFPINPGQATTFPWLANIAKNYEQYRFNGLIFEFVSTSSDAIASSTNLGLGQVMLATDYNAADSPYSDASQMLNAMFSNSGKPSQNIIHAIECAPTDQAQKLYYVRTGSQLSNTDIRLYDVGNFQLATQNMQSTYTGMGQLWASYDITFCKSVEFNEEDLGSLCDKYQIPTASNAHPLGNGRTLEPSSNLGTTIDSNGTIITFPASISSGFYMIIYVAYADAQEATASYTWTLTGCSAVNWALANAFPSVQNAGDSTAAMIRIEVIEITAASATVNFGTGGTVPLPSTGADLLIIELPSNVFGNLSAFSESLEEKMERMLEERLAKLRIMEKVDKEIVQPEAEEEDDNDTVVISQPSSDTESLLGKKNMPNSLRHSIRGVRRP